jgi:hypothetical protein
MLINPMRATMIIDLILRHSTTELCWMTMCVCCAAMRKQSNAHQSDESNNAQQSDSQTSDEQSNAHQSSRATMLSNLILRHPMGNTQHDKAMLDDNVCVVQLCVSNLMLINPMRSTMLIDLILRHNTTELCWMTMCVCCAAMRKQSNAHQSDESNNAQQYDSQTSDEQHTIHTLTHSFLYASLGPTSATSCSVLRIVATHWLSTWKVKSCYP